MKAQEGLHPLQLGVADMNAFPNFLFDHFVVVDLAIGEAEPDPRP